MSAHGNNTYTRAMSKGHGTIERWVLQHLAGQRQWDGWALVSSLPEYLAHDRRCSCGERYCGSDIPPGPTRAEVNSVYRAVRRLREQELVHAWTRPTTITWRPRYSLEEGIRYPEVDRLWVRLRVDGYAAAQRYRERDANPRQHLSGTSP